MTSPSRKIFFIGFPLFIVTVGIILLSLIPDTRPKKFVWQDTCDAQCESVLGPRMEVIDTAVCSTLKEMIYAKNDPSFAIGDRDYWFAAIQDKIISEQCQ